MTSTDTFLEVTRQQEERPRRWAVTLPNPAPSFDLDKHGTKLINESADVVSKRLDEYLRLSSIHAKFDSVNAQAVCATSELVQFQIFLYGGPEEKNTYVEVLRCQGCGFSFRNERKNKMKVAEQGVDRRSIMQQQEQKQHCNTMSYSISIENPTAGFLKSSYVLSTSKIENVKNMLRRMSESLDQSNSETTMFVLQNMAVQTMMMSSDMHSSSMNDKHHITSLLIIQNQHNIRDTIISKYEAHQPSSMDDEESEQIRNASIVIFTNGILALCHNENKNEKKQGFLEDQGIELFIEKLVPLLVNEVEMYEKHIFNTCLALKCLELIVGYSKPTHDMLKDEANAFETLVKKVRLYGHREHLKLENFANSMYITLFSDCRVFQGVNERSEYERTTIPLLELSSSSFTSMGC